MFILGRALRVVECVVFSASTVTSVTIHKRHAYSTNGQTSIRMLRMRSCCGWDRKMRTKEGGAERE